MQFVNLDDVSLTTETAIEILSIEVVRHNRAIPINFAGSAITIAIDNLDEDTMKTIRYLLPCCEVTFYLATKSTMDRALATVDKLNSDKLLLQLGT